MGSELFGNAFDGELMMMTYVRNILANFTINFFPSKILMLNIWGNMSKFSNFQNWRILRIETKYSKISKFSGMEHDHFFMERFKISMRIFWTKIQANIREIDFWAHNWKCVFWCKISKMRNFEFALKWLRMTQNCWQMLLLWSLHQILEKTSARCVNISGWVNPKY